VGRFWKKALQTVALKEEILHGYSQKKQESSLFYL